jgi:hypothetical protein
MPYPNRSHGISEGRNTVRPFYGLLTRYLRENLLAETTARKPAAPPENQDAAAAQGATPN